MRKTALVILGLCLVLVAGCKGGAAESTQTRSVGALAPTASPTPAALPAPSAVATASGPVSCVAAPLDLPILSGISEVSDQDHVEGNADARITVIEYADFQ